MRIKLLAWLAVLLFAAPVLAQKGPKDKKKPAAGAAPASITIDVAQTRTDFFGADADKASAAAVKLGQSRQAGALDALLDGLSMGLHPRVAAAALDGLVLQKSGAATEVLLHYARNRNGEVRARAISALGVLDDKRALGAVREAFTDGDKGVRAAAAQVAAARKDVSAADPMIALLKKGDEAMSPALAVIATPEIARRVAELIGDAPDRLLAESLGKMLLRTDLGKEDIYVELVRALGKIPGEEAVEALQAFISQTPEKPPRQSRREAQTIFEQKIGGGNPGGSR